MRTEWSGRNTHKDKLRNSIWAMLVEKNISVSDPYNEIPNFVGADKAAEKLSSMSIWKESKVIKCNPDDAQIPVRINALKDGKVLYMAVPQLTSEKCFVKLTQENIEKQGGTLEEASSWEGGMKYGELIPFEEMQAIDIAVVGCVAVTHQGARIGKGGGFADLEFGVLREYKLINPNTPIVTTIHDSMIIDDELIPIQEHDTFLSHIITTSRIIEVITNRKQPVGISWDSVQRDQLEEIPILGKLHRQRR